MKKLTAFVFSFCSVFAALMFLSVNVLGQGVAPTCASITISNLTYTQDFNALAATGTSSTVPTGFGFSETGTSARVNTEYTANTGSDNTADTYSYGASNSTERAFGSIRSGTLTPIIGACFVNNTGGTINSIKITYDGEQWRLGALSREDKLDFQYSLNATSLTTGTWIDVNTLDFVAPVTTGTVGALDGNATANRNADINSTISSLSIANGATFYIRFIDIDASGADDGLAIDNFSLMVSSLTAASAAVSGRVVDFNGRGLRLVSVTLTGGNLSEPRYAMTNGSGYYRFSEVSVGVTYVVTVISKRHIFQQSSKLINVNDNLTDVDFIGEPRK